MMPSTSRFARSICALFGLAMAAALLSACGDMPQRPVEEKVATAADGYGRAFGRIEYLEDGKETDWSTSALGFNRLTLFVRAIRTGEMQYMRIEGDGSLYWPLRAGEYEIVGYQIERRMVSTSRVTGRLMTTFSVSQPGQAVYIGDLRIQADRSRYGFGVLDQYAEALKRVEARLADGKLEAMKGLMRLEEQAGSFKRVTGICAKAWGLNCDKNYQGVEPLQPEGTAQRFPVTRDLAPLLEWKPTSRPEVSYDVAIYESLTLRYGLEGVPANLRGKLVAYAEGLREPRYSSAALQPGKKYEWTVRLRDGDTVSSWSTTSYSFFAVVAAGRGSGQAFGFETPGK